MNSPEYMNVVVGIEYQNLEYAIDDYYKNEAQKSKLHIFLSKHKRKEELMETLEKIWPLIKQIDIPEENYP